MMKLSVIGAGPVGLVTAGCFASQGCEVICVENDPRRLQLLQDGQIPVYEPGLEDCIREGISGQRLRFTPDIGEALAHGPIVFVCVGTPEGEDGAADLAQIENVAVEIAFHLTDYRLIVEKSTVPIKTHERIRQTIRRHTVLGTNFEVGCNPEFFREGCAVYDFFNPSRIILGVESERGKRLLMELYESFDCPKIVTDPGTAEIIKHSSNAFLATRISFANMLSDVCEALGTDLKALLEGVGADPRIGNAFMSPGVGFGGSCLPKDIRAFMHIAGLVGVDASLLQEVDQINLRRPAQLVDKVKQALWILKDKRVAVWGLSFKPETDDIRSAPSVEVVRSLLSAGAEVVCYDPLAMPAFQEQFPADGRISYSSDPYTASEGAHALVLLTEWKQFREADMTRVHKGMALPIVVDGRGVFDFADLKEIGFECYAFGVSVEAQLGLPGGWKPSAAQGARA